MGNILLNLFFVKVVVQYCSRNWVPLISLIYFFICICVIFIIVLESAGHSRKPIGHGFQGASLILRRAECMQREWNIMMCVKIDSGHGSAERIFREAEVLQPTLVLILTVLIPSNQFYSFATQVG